jgi:hypothetical protein
MQHNMALSGPENAPLAPRQEAAALALATGCTIGEAAKRSGAGARTIKTWNTNDPRFGDRISELRAEMTGQALGRLTDGMTKAASTLQNLLDAKSESIRLGAARTSLELGQRLQEHVEFERRIAALEMSPNRGRNVA